MLNFSGKTAFASGVQPISESLNLVKSPDYLVAVADLFQLEGAKGIKAKMNIVTNLADDHLDYYVSSELYIAAQRQVLQGVDHENFFVLNATDSQVLSFSDALNGAPRALFGSSQDLLNGDGNFAWCDRSHVQFRYNGKTQSYPLNNFRLRGGHNRENLCAAVMAALQLGVDATAIGKTIEDVKALPHRVQFLKRINSIAFYDDGACGNVQSLLKSLHAFNEPIILIAGGRDKNLDYSPLTGHIRQKVKEMILVGEAKEKMNRAIGDYTETFLVGTVEEAALMAYQKSRGGDVILFAPGCDARDGFYSFDERSDHFTRLVTQITQPRKHNTI
jgi:UDP-N-acetylmuramoylalanine--D-glutamate ligase